LVTDEADNEATHSISFEVDSTSSGSSPGGPSGGGGLTASVTDGDTSAVDSTADDDAETVPGFGIGGRSTRFRRADCLSFADLTQWPFNEIRCLKS